MSGRPNPYLIEGPELISERWVPWQGPTYFINERGRAALALSPPTKGSDAG